MAVKIIFLILLSMIFSANASTVGTLTTFSAGGQIKASEVNANFSAVATAVDDNAASIVTLTTSTGALGTRVTAAEATISANSANIGATSSLNTTNKTSHVGAINEVRSGTLSVPAANISGQISSTNLTTALTGYSTNTSVAATYGGLSAENTWAGANHFSGAINFAGGTLRLPNPDAAACDAGAEARVRYVSATKQLEYCDGTSWKYPGMRRFTVTSTIANGQSMMLNFGEAVSMPSVTIWKDIGGGAVQAINPDVNFPLTFNLSQVSLLNNSGGTLTLTLIALVP